MIAVRAENEPKHPAKFSPAVLTAAEALVRSEADYLGCAPDELSLLDPFAGTGRCHLMPCQTVGVEIEPEWAAMHPRTMEGDATDLSFEDDSMDLIFTSPVYGNRFSDHHEARDNSTRRSYTHDIGHQLNPANAGAMTFANSQPSYAPYRLLHRAAWAEVARVHKPDSLFILNVSNFIHKVKGEDVEHLVMQWHVARLLELGYRLTQSPIPVETPRMRYGANRTRADSEFLVLLRSAP